MSRYITPSKIVYVSLALLYLEDAVPVDSRIFILSYIVSPLLPFTPSTLKSSRDPEKLLSTTLETFHNDLHTFASSTPGRGLWDLLLEKLWEINSFDALYEFVRTFEKKVRKKREQREKRDQSLVDRIAAISISDRPVLLSRRSPVGIFLRRMSLEFDRLQLRDMLELWRAFLNFREPTAVMWRERNPSLQIASFNVNRLTGDQTVYQFPTHERPEAREWDRSVSDISRILKFQSDRMQSKTHL